MPVICSFDGLTIHLWFNDHEPPHFHVKHADGKAKIQIDPVRLVRGWLPNRMQRRVLAWAAEHREELLDNWRRVRNQLEPYPIAPPR